MIVNSEFSGNIFSARKIGISLSGGGIRAAIFHLGLFKWLAEHNLLEKIHKVSSVSGASLCVAMIYSQNDLKWPNSKEFLQNIFPSIEKILMSINLQTYAIWRLLISPTYYTRKANLLAKVLEEQWKIKGDVSELLGECTWYVNCTTYETGKRFRICKDNMGDYKIGYVIKPKISISHISAASAGFPGLIGPYCLKLNDYKWSRSRYPEDEINLKEIDKIHLWDGGVYDNLGLESIFKIEKENKLSEGLDFIIVSNASASISVKNHKKFRFLSRTKRILDITADQIGALRSRAVMDYIIKNGNGMYLKIGTSAYKYVEESKCDTDLADRLINNSLSRSECIRALTYPTTLKKPKREDYDLLLRHGYEVAECAYQCYQKQSLHS